MGVLKPCPSYVVVEYVNVIVIILKKTIYKILRWLIANEG